MPEEDPRLNPGKFSTGLTLAQAEVQAAKIKEILDAGGTPPGVTGGPNAGASGEDQE